MHSQYRLDAIGKIIYLGANQTSGANAMATAASASTLMQNADMLLDPVGYPGSDVNPIAARLDGLAGKTIGLLDNTKNNADLLLDEIGRVLLADHGVKAIVSRRKVGSSPGAPEDMLDELAACDAVVNAYGDCGSCTSWCVHDSVVLEKRGIPTATVNTDEFVSLGQMDAISLGLPGLPIVVVKHPMGDLPEPTVRERARGAVDQVVALLTTDARELEAQYTGKFLRESEKLRSGTLACPI
jgi:hypothetical protein